MIFSPEEGPFYSLPDHIVPFIITFKDVFCMLLSNVGAQFIAPKRRQVQEEETPFSLSLFLNLTPLGRFASTT